MKAWKLLIAGLTAETLLLGLAASADTAQIEKGKDLFARRCTGCHATDTNKEGPRLRGVFGRKAAGVSEFGYSDSLKKLTLRWDDANLDRWLTDPDGMAPGTDMVFKLNAPDERKAVIAWLKSLVAQ